MVPISASAAITKCHGLGGSNNGHFFLIILDAEKSKINVLDDLVPGDNSLPEGCLLADFGPHMMERESCGLSSLSIKDINHIMGAPPT